VVVGGVGTRHLAARTPHSHTHGGRGRGGRCGNVSHTTPAHRHPHTHGRGALRPTRPSAHRAHAACQSPPLLAPTPSPVGGVKRAHGPAPFGGGGNAAFFYALVKRNIHPLIAAAVDTPLNGFFPSPRPSNHTHNRARAPASATVGLGRAGKGRVVAWQGRATPRRHGAWCFAGQPQRRRAACGV